MQKHLWLRKSWHLLGNLIPFIYWETHIQASIASLIVLTFFFVSFAIDILRLKSSAFNNWFLTHFGILVKEHEKHTFTGSTYYFLAIALTIAIFPKSIAVCSTFYLTLGDPLAAIVGFYLPLKRIYHQKSLGGLLANFIICLLIGTFFWPLSMALIGAFTASLTELVSPIDDALTIPLISSLVLYVWRQLAL